MHREGRVEEVEAQVDQEVEQQHQRDMGHTPRVSNRDVRVLPDAVSKLLAEKIETRAQYAACKRMALRAPVLVR